MKPTQMLKDEHQAIKLMLAVLGRIADRLADGGQADPDHLTQAVDFIRNFADKCHHAKEEDLLFPAMEKAGVPRDGGPIGVMLNEHERGRSLVRAMAEAIAGVAAGDPAARAAFADNARGYIALLDQHIDKEDNILYQIADRSIAPADQDRLRQEFDRVEAEVTAPGEHERWHTIVHELDRLYP